MPDLKPVVLGLDWGTARVGVAATDPLWLMAHPVETLPAADEDALVAALSRIIEERGARLLVVGVPVNMDGSRGPAARAALAFAEMVGRRTGLPVETLDERLTSMDADSRLAQQGLHWRERKRRVDRAAAALILQSWLEKNASR